MLLWIWIICGLLNFLMAGIGFEKVKDFTNEDGESLFFLGIGSVVFAPFFTFLGLGLFLKGKYDK